MAKSKEKIIAQDLRRKGKSIRQIAKELNVAKASASIWCRDIVLTRSQIKELQKRMEKGSYEGRLKGARIQHEKRLLEIAELMEEGSKLIDSFSQRDKLLVGAALYWGEGMKKEGMARIANSDPAIIKFMISWFVSAWGIPKERFVLQILINQIHKNRIKKVERYWSNLSGIPRAQFYKTTLIKAKNKKFYRNYSEHYGTVILSVRRGSDLRHKIKGLIGKIVEIS